MAAKKLRRKKAPARKKPQTKKKATKPSKKRSTAPAKEVLIAEPVMTRRMGMALRVSLGTKLSKACSWNCLYCPWKTPKGKKSGKTHSNPTPDEVLSELRTALRSRKKIDSVVLTGASEPTAHPHFAEIVDGILKLRSDLEGKFQIHCITNGSGLESPATREACDRLDRVWIKVDCATEDLFKSTNRPADISSLKKLLEVITKLKSPWIQTTFWRNPEDSDLQNWSAENLLGLLDLYEAVKPAGIHLTTLRPNSVCADLRPINYENLESFALRVGELGIPVEVFP